DEEDAERVHRLEERRGDLPAEDDGPARALVGPRLHRVALLLVDRPEGDVERAEADERPDALPLVARERDRRLFGRGLLVGLARGRGGLLLHDRVGSEVLLTERDIEDQAERHADAGGGEAVVPAVDGGEGAADEVADERAEVDADVEDRISAIA